MEQDEMRIAASEGQYEILISGLMEKGFGVCDDFISPDLTEALRANLLRNFEQGLMRPAGVGRKFDHQKNAAIRGDVIQWIEPETTEPSEALLFQEIRAFVRYLNETCYTGINDFEFHYAYYAENSFYKRHIDQFNSDKGRKFSLVIYLNDNWDLADGGKLTLYMPDGSEEVIYPNGGRAVFFRSDKTEHEVAPAIGRPRLSIAGWLKSV